MSLRQLWMTLIWLMIPFLLPPVLRGEEIPLADAPQAVVPALKRVTDFYKRNAAAHGGYVYHYTLDFEKRWGEGIATRDQIWVQPPGTPTVGMAFLRAQQATGDSRYLETAQQAARALIYGQLKSGGWTNSIDFTPSGSKVAAYRNGRGKGKDNSTLDDGISQAAIRFLIQIDNELKFQDKEIHEATQFALEALLAAQFPNGGFPQVWTGPVSAQPIVKANYPKYDWRTEGRIKEYWTMYTLNDNVAGNVTDVLVEASAVYQDPRFDKALRKLGDFLILAQMPAPQPAWAQQYNYQMQPIWARRFEPAAMASSESQDAILALIKIAHQTGDDKYLQPIPAALDYLTKSTLPDGRLARYYELQTNRPLYMERSGKNYTLTYDDSRLPDHYGWKIESQIATLRSKLERARKKMPLEEEIPIQQLRDEVRQIISSLDNNDRWVSVYDGERLVGQPKFKIGERYLSSEVFSRNVTKLCELIERDGLAKQD